MIALAALACSCGDATKQQRPTLRKPAPDGWALLARGEIEQAEQRFAALAQGAAQQEGLAGLLRVAHVRSDWPKVSKLLARVAKQPTLEPRLAVSAAEAGLARPGKLAPQVARVAKRACAAKADKELGVRAGGICSRLAVRGVHATLRRCVAGCVEGASLPLSFVGNSPVVRVSVAGKPALFVVDTGASVSVLTQDFVTQAGLKSIASSAFRINSPAGLLDATRVVTTLKLGDLELASVPFTVLKLPLGGIAGIISPHGTLAEFAVRIDLRARELAVKKTLAVETGAARLPLLLANGNPIVQTRLGDRPRRPLYLDTGAYRTSLTTATDRLGKPLKRVGRTRVAGAGGGRALAWITRARLPARAGELAWTVEDPVLFVKGDAKRYRDVETAGLLGMDFLTGRVLLIDSPRRALHISRVARLSPWKVGAKQRLLVYGDAAPGGGATVLEQVQARKPDGSLVLEVTLTPKGKSARRFRLGMRDSWATRGGWLIARRAREAWIHDGKTFAPSSPRDLTREWLRVFYPFATQGKDAKIQLVKLRRGQRELQCTETSVDARCKGGEARLHIWECPALPWRTAKVELRAKKDQRVLWGLRHAELR